MQHIILSRKGFDSSSGGGPSPVLPDGTLLSLPIPEAGGIPYNAIRTSDGIAYADLMRQLGLRVPRAGAHLDPDLDAEALPRRPGWRPLFGQVSAAQAHLRRQGVGPGDLFLFFGLFRRTRWVRNVLEWAPDPPRHMVWGYLQVRELWVGRDCRTAPAWASDHPHVAQPARPGNTIYVARRHLTIDPSLPGAGRLSLHEGAVLSAHGRTSSIWRLPPCLWPADDAAAMSYHRDLARWSRLPDGDTLLHSVGRGQEFVMRATSARQGWALGLVRGGQPPRTRVREACARVAGF